MGRPDLAAGPARTSRPGYGRAVPVLAAAFCPHPPLLAPELAGGAAHELDDLRAHCDGVVGALAAYDVPVLVLGRGPTGRSYGPQASGTLAPWGVDVRAGGTDRASLPLSLTLGAWLLDRAAVAPADRAYRSVGDDADPGGAPEGDVVLLVMADGSSARTPKAPGGLHPAAEGYDAAVVAALAAGDALALLAAADSSGAAAVGAGGAATWRAAAALVRERPPAEVRLLAAEAPYGVGYPVAFWSW